MQQMTEPHTHTAKAEIPVAELADMAARSARLGVSLQYFIGVAALQTLYGFMHPEVVRFRRQVGGSVFDPKTEADE